MAYRLGQDAYVWLIGVTLVSLCLVIVWYWTRRNHYPLKQRRPYLVLSESVACLLTTAAFSCKQLAEGYSCGAFLYLTGIFFFPLCIISVLRIFLVHYWNVTQKAADFLAKTVPQIDKCEPEDKISCMDYFLLKHKDTISEPMLVKSAVIFMLIMQIADAVVKTVNARAVFNIPAITIECDEAWVSNSYFAGVVLIFGTAAFIAFYVMIRRIKENYGFKREMLGLLAAAVCISLFTILKFVPEIYDAMLVRTNTMTLAQVLLPTWIYIVFVLLRVIYWTYIFENKSKPGARMTHLYLIDSPNQRTKTITAVQQIDDGAPSIAESMRSFENMLSSDSGNQLFMQFLKTEFSVENLIFYNAVRVYKQNYPNRSDEQVAESARLIYRKFVPDSAPLSINITYATRRRICAKFEEKRTQSRAILANLTVQAFGHRSLGGAEKKSVTRNEPLLPTNPKTSLQRSVPDLQNSAARLSEKFQIGIFDEAYNEVQHLMYTDSFSRFRRSHFFKLLPPDLATTLK